MSTTTKTEARGRRTRSNAMQFMRFLVVGASGVVVNMVVLILVKKTGPLPDVSLFQIRPTAYHVRWYHVYSTIAFIFANLWNFQLNRWWTFRSHRHARWWREYWPFLAVGLLGQVIGLILLTMLMHQGSPIALPRHTFNDTSGLRTRLYWAQLIVIAVVTPLSFLLNKFWTFAAVRTHHPEAVPTHPAAERELEHLHADETDEA